MNQPSTIEQLAELAIKANKDMMSTSELELQSINDRIKQLQSELDNYMKAIAKGFISDTLQNQIEKTEAELQDHMTRRANHEMASNQIQLTAEHIEFFLHKMAKENPTTKRGRASIIDTFIKQATIFDDRVEIIFNYSNDLPQFKEQAIQCSHSCDMVDHQGFEPWTP